MMLDTANKLIESTKELKGQICKVFGMEMDFNHISTEHLEIIKTSFKMMDYSLELLKEQAMALDNITTMLEGLRKDIKCESEKQ